MENKTNIKVPKKYQHMIERIEKDGEGYWAYAEIGYEFGGMGCHTAHEYSQKDLLAMIRTLKECECDACEKHGQEEDQQVEGDQPKEDKKVALDLQHFAEGEEVTVTITDDSLEWVKKALNQRIKKLTELNDRSRGIVATCKRNLEAYENGARYTRDSEFMSSQIDPEIERDIMEKHQGKVDRSQNTLNGYTKALKEIELKGGDK